MKSIKPGRGPSQMGMVGSIGVALFGVFWCILVGLIGAWFMIPFGLVFIGMMIYNAIYNYHNVTSKNRYSIVDIVDENEESDPFNERYGEKAPTSQRILEKNGPKASFCPYCGKPVDVTFDFCPKCGKKLPD
mgnify:FL=1